MTDTEYKLKLWRGDQIGAERLSATILHIDGFSSVDPQCPLGGPDGLKDVLCEKNKWSYIAAVYFPTSDKKFRELKVKFLNDLDGVQKNSSDGIVFLTNQQLSPAQRNELASHAETLGHKSIIYHLERIRAILDSPSGYGARLEFLDIDMSREEQLSFFSQWNRSFADSLHEHGLMIIREIGKKIELLSNSTEKLGTKAEQLNSVVMQTHSMVQHLAPPTDKIDFAKSAVDFTANEYSVGEICLLHRALLFDAPPSSQAGCLRSNHVWLGGPRTTKATATFVPPEPGQVPKLLAKLLFDWRQSFDELTSKSATEKIAAMTRFHHGFVSIHPFMDGNGRIARFLLTQQVESLLHETRHVIIEDRRPYFEALAMADNGEYAPLESEITQAITGVEFVAGSPCQMSGQRCPSCKEGVMDINSMQDGVCCNRCGLDIPA
jgi:fido (protein-threonine AMPylation protein)